MALIAECMETSPASADLTTDQNSAPADTSASATQPAQDDMGKRIDAAKGDPVALAALTREFLENDQRQQMQQSNPPAADAQVVEADANATDETDSTEAATDEQPATDEAATDADSTASEAAEEGENTDETDTDDAGGTAPAKPKQYRLRGETPLERRTYELRKVGVGFEEALAIARKELAGTAANGSAADTATAASANEPALPKSLADVDAQIEALNETRWKAMEEEFDTAKAAKAEREIHKLQKDREALSRQHSQQQEAAAREYKAKFDVSTAKAHELYEFTSKPDSPEMQRVREIDAIWSETNPDWQSNPDRPLILVSTVAAERRIAPRPKTPVKPSAPAKAPVASVQKKPAMPPLAGGSSRTTAQQSQTAQVSARIKAARGNPYLIEQLTREMLAQG